MVPVIRQATPADAIVIASILLEAEVWLRSRGAPLWPEEELAAQRVAPDIAAGEFFIVEWAGAPVGAFKFQLEDLEFWPDIPPGEAAYVHRLAVRRRFAGQGLSQAMLAWAADRARALGRHFLRLDCESSRPRLRGLYERFGFRFHSERQVGRYHVARYQLPL